MRFLGKMVMWVLVAGLLLALLRAFNWDPFGVIGWAWSWASGLVTTVSDAFASNPAFQKAVETQGAIIGFITAK